MLLKTAFFTFSSARLINIPISENNFIDFSDYEHLIQNKDDFNFAVFTDAQFGKYDKENNGDGTNVAYDIARVEEMCRQISAMTEPERPAFIMNLGDIAHGHPHDEGASNPGSNPQLRPFQIAEYLDAMRNCPEDIPQFAISGNRDDGNESYKENDMLGFEKLFHEKNFWFKAGNRYFIALETQVFFLTNEFAETRKREQEHFIKNTLDLLPSDAPKTVFMHKPLYIENFEEYHASDVKEKSIPTIDRMRLLSDFDSNSVDSVFSGHTHFQNLDPPAYGSVQQFVLTSVSKQNEWTSKEKWGPNGETMNYGTCTPSFYLVNSKASGVTVDARRVDGSTGAIPKCKEAQ